MTLVTRYKLICYSVHLKTICLSLQNHAPLNIRRAWEVVVHNQDFNLQSALKLLSLTAFVAGIMRINFTAFITSQKYSLSTLLEDFR